jgi:hypothetical protein
LRKGRGEVGKLVVFDDHIGLQFFILQQNDFTLRF